MFLGWTRSFWSETGQKKRYVLSEWTKILVELVNKIFVYG